MKWLFITLAIMGSYFAQARNNPVNISPAVLTAFYSNFQNASKTEWAVLGDIYRVKFNYESQFLYAFYNEEGERLCIGQVISLQQLPPTLAVAAQKHIAGNELIETFEISNDSSVSYYITMINGTNKITLKSKGLFSWTVHNKTRLNSNHIINHYY